MSDRTVLLWSIKDLLSKDHKSLRVNIEFDFASLVKWSPDRKAFIICRANDNNIEVYKVEKKKDSWIGPITKAITFPKVHEEDIIGLGISCTGRFIMTCSNKTTLILWDLKGQELTRVDTYLMSTICAKISPCGRFIVASGFAPDVKVWEVCFSKTGEFLHLKRAFELTGHKSGVYDVAFDVDTSHIATVSKDGTWKVFNTNVEYNKGEDPHLQISAEFTQNGGDVHIAMSPNAEVVVIAVESDLLFYSVKTGILDHTIENIYTGSITTILFEATGNFLFAAGEKHIRIFNNITGYKCNIVTGKEKLKQNITSATRERLQHIISDSQTFLKTIKN